MNLLLDSNIVIYATLPEYQQVRDFVADSMVAVSLITHLEVLGYHKLTDIEENAIRRVLAATSAIAISDMIVGRAIAIRRIRKIGIGDAIVAATAFEHGLTLATRNVNDFKWISGLQIVNPFD